MNERTLREYVRTILSEKFELDLETKEILQKIDDGPYHMLPVDELDARELDAAEMLVMQGLVKRMPPNARFPERFVLSASGSHATSTFDVDTLHDERGEIYKARRQGTLKTKKW